MSFNARCYDLAVENPIYKRCICGGLIVSIFVGGVVQEVCEHGANASACPKPRVEFIHSHYPEPQGPSLARTPYVLGTATDPRMDLNPIRFNVTLS